MTIILYLGFLIGLIYNFEKLSQCDLNKKNENQGAVFVPWKFIAKIMEDFV